ncbi:hypothetical protein DY000_02053443 [Brassica cretica]|uniref:MnmG N-terminal domain-containing protein n=1 Tax=Brassica cretica TaxID=69181 RepID=A0ABQ7ALA4_BRACR|nr:hypothetical protein DY000_02053443 [Brassica cretica]
MPSSTGSNKETQLIFSSDPASLECLIRKEIRSSSIDNNTSSSVDSRQPPSTQTPVSSTDTRSSPSTEDTPLPSIDTFHPISIDTSVRTSIDTEPRDMVATLILVLDERETCMTRKLDEFRRIALVSIDAGLRTSIDGLQSKSITGSPEHRSTTPTESIASCNVVGIMTHEDFTAKYPHPPSPVYVKIDRHSDPVIDRQKETAIDRLPPAPIDRRAPLTYRVQMPKIDVPRLNALRPQPKPSDNPPEAIRTPSDGATDPMEMDRTVWFKDKESHQIFLEPEGRDVPEIYVQGFSTGMPENLQLPLLRSFPGLENCAMLRPAYAVGYDYLPAHHCSRSLMTKKIEGLFFSGQINGTTGYEEAAAQGIISGINAARHSDVKKYVVLESESSYIGTLIDDLVTKDLREPYRMLTRQVTFNFLVVHYPSSLLHKFKRNNSH